MKCLSIFTVCLAATLLAGVHGRLEGVPEGWYETTKVSDDERIPITFAIKQTNVEWLADKLKAVSYPNSPEYTNYMNFDEIAEHVHGRPESVHTLLDILESVEISEYDVRFTLGRDFAVVDMPIAAAEQLFSTKFYHYQHADYPELKTITSSSFKLPTALEGHVDFVSGVRSFNHPIKRKLIDNIDHLETTPETIAKDYNTSGYISNNTGNSQAVAGFLKQYYNPNDLTQFQKHYDLPVMPITKVVGKNDPDHPGSEANLDVQYICATGRGVSTWFVSNTNFLAWILGQINDTASPWVHSVSYGGMENSSDSDYMQRMDTEFMKFGVSGRTVVLSSGDSGVFCQGIDGKYTPEWPTSSPYVTAVGGTTSLTQVWSNGGGGFSNVFPMPDYQKQAVEAYLKSGKAPSTTKFNKDGRAYPDVSAFSTNCEFVNSSKIIPDSGTSCSAPIFAGIVSSLNDVRLNKGQKTLGFLNPLLYQTLMGNGFFDITEGSNGGFDPECKGFEAIKGWDPASGWGSPNFGLLKSLV